MKFKITNITCDACLKLSKSALESLPGIKEIRIEKNGLTSIESEQNLTWPEVKDALAQVGKQASLIS